MPDTGRIAFTRMEQVVYGVPAAVAMAELVQQFDAQRVFVMASGTLNRKTQEVARIVSALGTRFAGVFDRLPAHTPRASVIEASALATQARADLIVSVGGGSTTDAAKAVQLCMANDVREPAALDALLPRRAGDGTWVPASCKPPTLRQVAIPTTLSAGEFSAIAGVTNEVTHAKELFRHPGIIPAVVILDPAITLHTPEWLFLSTGIRAVDHCVEGYCAPQAHAYAQAHSLHGLGLLASGLRRVMSDPRDLDARLDCQLGAWLSMTAVATGVPMGASHGIGYVLGAAYGVPHGYTSCVMLPAVLAWNRSVNAHRQARLAAAMGEPDQDAGVLLRRLVADLGMPGHLAAVGIGRDEFAQIARQALETPWVPRNPRAITSAAEVEEILSLAA